MEMETRFNGFEKSNEYKEFLEIKLHFTETIEALEQQAKIKYYKNQFESNNLSHIAE